MQLIPAHDATIDDMATQTALRAIAGADLAAGTQTKYRRAIERYVTATGAPITDTPALREHASTLPVSGRAQLKAAVRLWAKRAIDDVKAVADMLEYKRGHYWPAAIPAELQPALDRALARLRAND